MPRRDHIAVLERSDRTGSWVAKVPVTSFVPTNAVTACSPQREAFSGRERKREPAAEILSEAKDLLR